MPQTQDYESIIRELGGRLVTPPQTVDARRSEPEQSRRLPTPDAPPARSVSPRPPPREDSAEMDYASIVKELGGRIVEPHIRSENEKDAEGNAVLAPMPTYPHAQLGEAVKGFGKKAADRALELVELIRSAPVLGDAVQSASRYFSEMTPEEEAEVFSALHQQLKPSNTAQEYGAMGEQIAEAIVPATKVTKAAGWTAAKIGPALSKYLGKTAGHLLPTAAVEATGAGAIAKAQGGDAEIGAAFGAAFPVAGAVIRGAKNTVRGALINPNAVERDAVAFGLEQGIPVDLGTASGNRFVKGTQRLADETLLGSVVSGKANQARDKGLATIGEQLAAKGHRTSVTTEQAGEGIRRAVTGKITQLHDEASNAYDALRAIEADPKHVTKIVIKPEVAKTTSDGRRAVLQEEVAEHMGLAVDVKTAKEKLRPLYERLKRESELVPLQGGKARTLVALDRLENGPDFAPLSIVDDALSDLKAMARGAEIPELRTQAQGIAAHAVKELDEQVRKRASQAGPDAIQALMKGRAATVEKYGVAEVLDALKDEPVRTVKSLMAPNDSAIEQLRTVAKVAPAEVPKIGRAYLDDMLRKATNEGAFDHAARMQSTWSDLGPETKTLLFPDADHVKDLDRFFLLAKKLAENPNPSGTALQGIKYVEAANLVRDPLTQIPLSLGAGALSKILRSPTVVKALTRAMQAGNGPHAKTAMQRLIDASDEAGVVIASQAGSASERSAATVPGARK